MQGFFFRTMILGALATGPGGSLPFWMTANQYGIMPESSGAVAYAKAGQDYDLNRTLSWNYAVSLAATTDSKLFAPEIYTGLKYKHLSLDLGIKQREQEFLAPDPVLGSLSSTSGHLLECGNARSMPGYALNLEPFPIPFTKEHLFIYGKFADYKTLDSRYISDALVHRTQAYLRFVKGRFQLDAGLDHFAMWAGTSPEFGKLPIGLAEYLRVISGRPAGHSGPAGDIHNVVGNQGGAELLRLSWDADYWKLTAQHEIPYEDMSGMKFKNFPDGVNTIHLHLKEKSWISDILYEYHYTLYQSGPIQDYAYDQDWQRIEDPDICIIGCDNYFNHGEYKNGWTYYGRTIGNPLMYSAGTLESGSLNPSLHNEVGVENNRIKAHHLGIGGYLFKRFPYRFMLTYSKNFGTYYEQYAGESQYQKPWGSVKETPLHQFCAGLSGTVPEPFKIKGFDVIYGLYYDCGDILKENLGVSAGLIFSL